MTILAKWWIAPGREEEAAEALGILALAVEARESLTTMYLIHTSPAEGSRPPRPGTEVVFVGGWPDREAFEQHLAGPVFTGWIAEYADLFVTDDGGDPFVTTTFIDRRAGFIRSWADQEARWG